MSIIRCIGWEGDLLLFASWIRIDGYDSVSLSSYFVQTFVTMSVSEIFLVWHIFY